MSKPIEPGCLALVTASVYPENIGRLVTVIKRVPRGSHIAINTVDVGTLHVIIRGDNHWWCRPEGALLAYVSLDDGTKIGTQERSFPEWCLKRIDDPDGVDETLTWKEVPTPSGSNLGKLMEKTHA